MPKNYKKSKKGGFRINLDKLRENIKRAPTNKPINKLNNYTNNSNNNNSNNNNSNNNNSNNNNSNNNSNNNNSNNNNSNNNSNNNNSNNNNSNNKTNKIMYKNIKIGNNTNISNKNNKTKKFRKLINNIKNLNKQRIKNLKNNKSKFLLKLHNKRNSDTNNLNNNVSNNRTNLNNNRNNNRTNLNNNKNNSKIGNDVIHPLNEFVFMEIGNKKMILIKKGNRDKLDYENMYVNAFMEKLLEILNFSFEKEREHHISLGSYSPGYKHNLLSIKSNIHNDKMSTFILCNDKLEPLSMLYLENNENDYNKIFSFCTDKNNRDQGNGSLLLNNVLTNQMNNNKNKIILEVYNDEEIKRESNDVLQNKIMNIFNTKGFENIQPEHLNETAKNNLVSQNKGTKVMSFNPKLFINNNKDEMKNLNSTAKKYCCN